MSSCVVHVSGFSELGGVNNDPPYLCMEPLVDGHGGLRITHVGRLANHLLGVSEQRRWWAGWGGEHGMGLGQGGEGSGCVGLAGLRGIGDPQMRAPPWGVGADDVPVGSGSGGTATTAEPGCSPFLV